ncbi:MAG TPA: hypothetical protein DCE56_04905, partial [Cyanobacteria bacterium UBA8553]|nr:hypothetical protein [Cyanobacteria bacterium UBA8553]
PITERIRITVTLVSRYWCRSHELNRIFINRRNMMQQNQLLLETDFLNSQPFKVADDILFRKVENEAVLLHID